MLRQEYGYNNVEVINAGVPYYSTWDTLVNMAFRLPELEPDLVIVYHAINDVYARNMPPKCYRGYNPMRGLSPIAGIWSGGSEDLSPSVLVRYISINMGWMDDPNSLEKSGIHTPDMGCGREEISFEDALKVNPPIYFERNLRNIVLLGQGNGIPVMLSSWAYYPESDVMKDYMKTASDEHNRIIRQVAEEMDAPFYDLVADLDIHNPDYWEWTGYHQSPTAAREQADLYAAFLIEEGLLPAPE